MLVNTVRGEVDINELGITLIHEHMSIKSDEVLNQFPHLFHLDREIENAVNEVNKAKKFGVQTICDPTVLGLGRDVKLIRKVSEFSDVNILVATGIYTYNEIPIHFRNQSIDYMADLFCRDIEVGIQNTDIKAAFIKCSADEHGITPDIEKVIRAAARASIRTNKPIMTHSKPSKRNGLDQIKILLEEGVRPSHILIGHTGDSDNIDYIKEVLSYGVFIGMDRYGLDKFATTEIRNTTLINLLNQGYEKQIFLSQDYCCNTDWYSEEHKMKESPRWNMEHIFKYVIPRLQEYGVNQEKIKTIMVENSKNWLKGE